MVKCTLLEELSRLTAKVEELEIRQAAMDENIADLRGIDMDQRVSDLFAKICEVERKCEVLVDKGDFRRLESMVLELRMTMECRRSR